MRLPSPRLALLCALYFVQGLPFGFQSTALPVYLRQQGLSLTAIGLAGALWLPWGLKALWAPLVDRYGSARIGRRKTWILPMQAGLTASCAAAAFVSSAESLPLLLGLIFLMNVFAATQDIAVDGLAVDMLRPDELGPGNAVQVVGYKLGQLTGGGLLVWASERIGWSGLFLSMAALCLAVFLVTLFAREPTPRTSAPREGAPADTGTDWRELFGRLKAALLLPGTGWLLLFVGTYKLGESMSDVLYKPFLVDSGITAGQIGLWLGTWGTGASLIGSVLGGVLAARLPLLGAVALTATLRVVPLVGRWLLVKHGVTEASVIGVTLAEEFFGGALTTAMFAFMMSRVDRRIGGTHYTLLASVEVWGKAPVGPLAGWLADSQRGLGWGYGGVFMLAVVLSLAFLLLLLPLRRQQRAGATPQPAS